MGKVVSTKENGEYTLDLIDSETTGDEFSVRLWSKISCRHVFWTEVVSKKEAERRFKEFSHIATQRQPLAA